MTNRMVLLPMLACVALATFSFAAPADAAREARITGTAKADVLRGTAKADTIYGLGGDDRISGLAGDDRIIGGPGKDAIACGPGRDTVIADALDTVAADCEIVNRPAAAAAPAATVTSAPTAAPPPVAAPPLVGTLTSSAFAAGSAIAATFSCDGTNTSPDLSWSGMPSEAKAFALVLDDQDSRPANFTHWITWNIAASATGLAAGQNGPGVGNNDTRSLGYFGPCPPAADGPHRYVFHLYALSGELALAAGANRAAFDTALAGKALGEARLTGTFDH